MLSKDEVIWGYRMVLGRDPESDQIIAQQQQNFCSISDFRKSLLGSAEFQAQNLSTTESVVYSGYQTEDLAVFDYFSSARPEPAPGFITDYHGSRARVSCLWDGVQHLDGVVMPKPIPGDYHAETAEWLGVLKSVLASKGRFVAMELGAGMGPWLVAGTVAARLRGINNTYLLGVEADPGRFALMQQNLQDNGIDPDHHTLICGGVGVVSGKAKWPHIFDPRNDAGARPIRRSEGCEEALDHRDLNYLDGKTAHLIDVDILAFDELLGYQPLWDLVHIDVQGTEVELCSSSLEVLSKCVRYLVVGTHSRKIDGDLLALMFEGGWILEHEEPARFVFNSQSPTLERMTSADGIQVWRNPSL